MLLIPLSAERLADCGFSGKADSAVSLHSIFKRRLCVWQMQTGQDAEREHILSREERIREIQSFNLLSDVFMSVALKDVPACQHILRILTGIDDLKVKEVRTQYTISRIKTHSVRLDVLAETGRGKLYHIEIQRKDEIDPPKRIRYNGSLIDAEFLAKGMKYESLLDRIHFYISERDIYHCGKAIYPIEKDMAAQGFRTTTESISFL